MAIVFRRSAGRHGVSQDRARFVVEHCPCPLFAPDEGADGLVRVIFLGPDGGGDEVPITAKGGKRLTDEDLDRLADEAAAGYDLSQWRPRRGRPFLDQAAGEHAPRISVRVPAGLRDRVLARAASEGRSISDVLRALLEEYVHEPRQVP